MGLPRPGRKELQNFGPQLRCTHHGCWAVVRGLQGITQVQPPLARLRTRLCRHVGLDCARPSLHAGNAELYLGCTGGVGAEEGMKWEEASWEGFFNAVAEGSYLQADLGCVQWEGEEISKAGRCACPQELHSRGGWHL